MLVAQTQPEASPGERPLDKVDPTLIKEIEERTARAPIASALTSSKEATRENQITAPPCGERPEAKAITAHRSARRRGQSECRSGLPEPNCEETKVLWNERERRRDRSALMALCCS